MDFEDDLGDLGDFDFAEVDRLVEQHQATRVPVDGGQGAPVGAATDVKSAGTGVGESVRLQESKWHCAKCTLINDAGADVCLACQQPRFVQGYGAASSSMHGTRKLVQSQLVQMRPAGQQSGENAGTGPSSAGHRNNQTNIDEGHGFGGERQVDGGGIASLHAQQQPAVASNPFSKFSIQQQPGGRNSQQQTLDCHLRPGPAAGNTDGGFHVGFPSSQAHEVAPENARNWVYPINTEKRLYQYNCVKTALFANTLVSLPTGLGKTLIAAVVMYNYYRWFPRGKIIFMAPSRPLVNQQVDACFKIMGIPKADTAELTGGVTMNKRDGVWTSKRVFFVTPQTLDNDLKSESCEWKKDIVLLVIDEAHRSTGDYAYVKIVEKLREARGKFRVLGLSATPGSDTKKIQEVLTNLHIARVEYRCETDADVAPYTFGKDIEKIVVKHSNDVAIARRMIEKLARDPIAELCHNCLIFKNDVNMLSPISFVNARKDLKSRLARIPQHIQKRMNSAISLGEVLVSLLNKLERYDAKEALEYYMDKENRIPQNFERHELKQSLNVAAKTMHPKVAKLKEVLDHFFGCGDAGADADGTRKAIIFTRLRSSVDAIVEALAGERHIHPTKFVGQGSTKKSKGQNQKQQKQVIQDFRNGDFNTLVATSVGEEGLDMPQVDLIVNYDVSEAPVKMVQRMGRTGRHRQGRVIVLISEGKEADEWDNMNKKNYTLGQELRQAEKKFKLSQHSPRMLPHKFQPTCLEMHMQPALEDEPKASGKRKAKGALVDGRVKSIRNAVLDESIEDDDDLLQLPTQVINLLNEAEALCDKAAGRPCPPTSGSEEGPDADLERMDVHARDEGEALDDCLAIAVPGRGRRRGMKKGKSPLVLLSDSDGSGDEENRTAPATETGGLGTTRTSDRGAVEDCTTLAAASHDAGAMLGPTSDGCNGDGTVCSREVKGKFENEDARDINVARREAMDGGDGLIVSDSEDDCDGRLAVGTNGGGSCPQQDWQGEIVSDSDKEEEDGGGALASRKDDEAGAAWVSGGTTHETEAARRRTGDSSQDFRSRDALTKDDDRLGDASVADGEEIPDETIRCTLERSREDEPRSHLEHSVEARRGDIKINVDHTEQPAQQLEHLHDNAPDDVPTEDVKPRDINPLEDECHGSEGRVEIEQEFKDVGDLDIDDFVADTPMDCVTVDEDRRDTLDDLREMLDRENSGKEKHEEMVERAVEDASGLSKDQQQQIRGNDVDLVNGPPRKGGGGGDSVQAGDDQPDVLVLGDTPPSKSGALDGSPANETDLRCEVCGGGHDDGNMLLCDGLGCNKGFHTYCLQPPLEEIPPGSWFCDSCKKAKNYLRPPHDGAAKLRDDGTIDLAGSPPQRHAAPTSHTGADEDEGCPADDGVEDDVEEIPEAKKRRKKKKILRRIHRAAHAGAERSEVDEDVIDRECERKSPEKRRNADTTRGRRKKASKEKRATRCAFIDDEAGGAGGMNDSPIVEDTDDDGFIVHNSGTPDTDTKHNQENTPINMRAVYMNSLLSPLPVFHGFGDGGKAHKCYVCRFAQEPLLKCSKCDRRYHAECVGLRAHERGEESHCMSCKRGAEANLKDRDMNVISGRETSCSSRSQQMKGSVPSPVDCSEPCPTLPGAGLRGYRILSDDDIASAEKVRRSSLGTLQQLPLSGSIRPPLPTQPEFPPADDCQGNQVVIPTQRVGHADPPLANIDADAAAVRGVPRNSPARGAAHERVEFEYVEPIQEDYGMEIDF